MPRLLAIAVFALLAACGDDGGGGYCLPQGRVAVGAIGTSGAALQNYADCYAGGMSTLSLDKARGATVTGNSIVFDDSGLSATVDDATCRVSITYEFSTMLSNNVPADGTSQFSAGPDGDSWSMEPTGSVTFSWMNSMGSTSVCGNQIDGVTIQIQPN